MTNFALRGARAAASSAASSSGERAVAICELDKACSLWTNAVRASLGRRGVLKAGRLRSPRDPRVSAPVTHGQRAFMDRVFEIGGGPAEDRHFSRLAAAGSRRRWKTDDRSLAAIRPRKSLLHREAHADRLLLGGRDARDCLRAFSELHALRFELVLARRLEVGLGLLCSVENR